MKFFPDPPPKDSDRSLTLTDYIVAYISIIASLWTVYAHGMVASGQSFATLGSYAPLTFIMIVVTLGFFYGLLDKGRSLKLLQARLREREGRLYILAGAVLSYSIILFVSYWDLDEAFYANLPVAMLEHPEIPLMTQDGMHGYPGLPILYPTYALHSFEMLAAYLGKTFAADPVFVLHIIFPGVYNLLALIAWYKLIGYFFPRYRYLGLLCFVLMGVALFGSNEAPGANQFFRLYQGKTVAGLVILPLLTYYSARFLTAPSCPVWVILFALNIFAVGLTSTALFWNLLLLVIMGALLWGPTLRQTCLSAMLVLSAAYLVLAGLWVRSSVYWPKVGISEFDNLDIAGVIPYVFGYAQGALVLLGCVVVWFLDEGLIRNRLLRGLPLVVLGLILTPPVAHFIAENITSNAVFWRLVLLIPAYLYLFATLVWIGQKFSGETRVLIIALWIGALLAPNGFTSHYRGEISWPARKASSEFYTIAEAAHRNLPAGKALLGPDYIVMYVPWMTPQIKLVGVRGFYFELMREPFGAEESAARRKLMDMIGNGNLYDAALFRHWLPKLDVGAVIVRSARGDTDLNQDMIEDLSSLGFTSLPEKYSGDGIIYRIFIQQKNSAQ